MTFYGPAVFPYASARDDGRSAASAAGDRYRMTMNKKQKKQIDAIKNKIQRLQQLLNAARNQPDDPAEAPQLEKQIAALNAEIEKIRSE
jgi:hypothetical protein